MTNFKIIYKNRIIIGIFFIFSALLFNQYILQLFSHDGRINSNDKIFIIWIFDICALLIGFTMIFKNKNRNITWKHIVLIIVMCISVLLLVEVSLRVYFSVKHHFTPPSMSFEQQIGWQNSPYISITNDHELHGRVKYSTDKYGFRKFGDTEADFTKLFIIGDSFTMADNINDGKTYYDYILNNHSNVELFTYGGGGYGSIQEYMILDKYFDEINPDIIIWQFCDNDIINNNHDLESRSLIHGGLDPRPYYIENDIKVLLPWRRHSKLYNIVSRLYIVRLISLELKILQKDKLNTIEKSITRDNQFYQKSIQTTDKIMKMVVNRIGGTPLISFNAKIEDDFPIWWSQCFENISKKNNFVYLQQIDDSLALAKISGVKVDYSPIDEHWNETGHKIVGKVLLDYLVQNNYLK